MGSMTRRLKRNILAKEMAVKAGVVPPVIVYRDPDGNEKKRVFLRQVPMIYYRRVMLRIKSKHRRHMKDAHDFEQKSAALREKRTRKPRNEGSMVRRFFKGLFKGRDRG
jgi:hypothetical protein